MQSDTTVNVLVAEYIWIAIYLFNWGSDMIENSCFWPILTGMGFWGAGSYPLSEVWGIADKCSLTLQ